MHPNFQTVRSLSAAILVCFLSICTTSILDAQETAPAQPKIAAPDGFRWVLNSPYSDEFNGDKLDSEKWHDHYPGWSGRIPGKFMPSSLSVKDGCLRIQCSPLDPPLGTKDKPDEKIWTIACGAVQSKERKALYGYYECRMKASSISTSSTFWLKNVYPGIERPYVATELDIVECIGNAQRWPDFGDHMIGNTHIEIHPKLDPDNPRKSLSDLTDQEKKARKAKFGPVGEKKSHKVSTRVNEAFHTYGCWWVDAKTMKFYLDGEHVFTINPPTDLVAEPFNQPMYVNLVCETYNWEFPPTAEELKDDTKNTTLYDYVRAYKLVPIK